MFYFPCDRTIAADVLVACFILPCRAAIDQFGLLDEDFWIYGEDFDWCWRSGWKVMFFPGAEAIHYCGGTSANDPLRLALTQ